LPTRTRKKVCRISSLQVYLQSIVGYMVCFPSTSSMRYSSTCEAAAELLVQLDFYCKFLEVIRNLKDKRTFTNIEQNVYSGLHDKPTLTELSVLALYVQAITHPYMCQVHGHGSANTNLCDLGPVQTNWLLTVVQLLPILISSYCPKPRMSPDQWTTRFGSSQMPFMQCISLHPIFRTFKVH
jgi:hypothetical protein